MSLQNTTTASYEQNIRPNLTVLHAEIRRALRTFPEGLTNKELAKLCGKDASTISGIVGPMARPKTGQPQVYEAGERKCSVTGNVVKFWRLTSLRPQPPASKPEHKPISLFDGVPQDSNNF